MEGNILNTEITYQHLKFFKDAQKPITIQKDPNAIVYIASGEFQINKQHALSEESLLISSQEVGQIDITAKSIGSIVVCSGVPHKEPIYQHGPYVD